MTKQEMLSDDLWHILRQRNVRHADHVIKVINDLYKEGVSFNKKAPDSAFTPFQQALFNGQDQLILELLDNLGADINAPLPFIKYETKEMRTELQQKLATKLADYKERRRANQKARRAA